MHGLSRRAFLRRGSAALAAAAVAPSLSRPRGQERKLGYALVGLGSLSTNQIAPALLKTQQCRLAGIVTGSPEKVKPWRERYGIPERNVYSYETFDRIADNPDIDVVYVVLPNGLHAEYTIRAARAGKHVLCEKPMANTARECEQMIAACAQAGRKLAVGYRLHFEPHNREMMRIGRERQFGPVKLVEASFGFRIGNPNQWRLDRALAGGGALMDVGIYAIQGARYVTGEEPVAVTAQEFKTDPVKFREVDETILWQLRFPGGAVASSNTSYAAGVNRLYLAAEQGWAELQPAYSYGGLRGRTSRGSLEFPEIDQFAAQMDDFAACILNDRPSRVPGEEGLRDLRIIEAVYRAARTGETVSLG